MRKPMARIEMRGTREPRPQWAQGVSAGRHLAPAGVDVSFSSERTGRCQDKPIGRRLDGLRDGVAPNF